MIPLADSRFWAKVNKNGPIPSHRPDLGPCWIWTGSLHKVKGCAGYGRIRRGNRRFMAHTVAYCSLRGPIPISLEPDHLCRVTNCVNPWHIEAVTHKVNTLRGNNPLAQNARKIHCPKGHSYDRYADGRRFCRICTSILNKEWKRKRFDFDRRVAQWRKNNA